jgi:hypothetical protein
LLDEARSGPFYLRQRAIADMVVEAILYNAAKLEHYLLHAFGHAESRSSAGYSSLGFAQANEIVEGHYQQTGQHSIGNDGKPFLARRDLRPARWNSRSKHGNN